MSIIPNRSDPFGVAIRSGTPLKVCPVEDVLFHPELTLLLAKVILLGLILDPQHLWDAVKRTCKRRFKRNHRKYFYKRISLFYCIEVVVCYFPPGSHTGIHDHPSINLDLVVCGSIDDEVYRTPIDHHTYKDRDLFEGDAPILKAQKHLTPRSFTVLGRYQLHRMATDKSGKGAITLNFHFPRRPDILD
jgi:hypothetical protein